MRGSALNFVPRGIPGGRNFCSATAGRNGFPLERVVFRHAKTPGPRLGGQALVLEWVRFTASCRIPSDKPGTPRRSQGAGGPVPPGPAPRTACCPYRNAAGEGHCRHAALGAGVLGHGVRQLDLTACAWLGSGQQGIDLRGQQHPPQDGVVAEFLPFLGFSIMSSTKK